MKNISEVSSLDDINGIIILNNVKLLDSPIIDGNTTILKILCEENLKYYLKKLEKISKKSINLDINFDINFDLEQKNDYYNLIINKKINKIINQLNINNKYHIGVRLASDYSLWILESIEIADEETNEDINDDEDIVDYYELREDLLLKLNIKINKFEEKLKKINIDLENFNKIKIELTKNFNKNQIENYYKLIN